MLAWEYLKKAQSKDYIPNFWMSEEYIQKRGLVWTSIKTGWEGFVDPDNPDEWFFPPIKSHTNDFPHKQEYSLHSIYSTFVYKEIPPALCFRFLDWQFFYDPIEFTLMVGSHWSVFRKNVRKYPARCSRGIGLNYIPMKGKEHYKKIESLLLKWSDGRELYDPEVLVRYAFEGGQRYGLFNNNELVGMNIADRNFNFINYRYCIDNKEPFLQEYLRFLFYTHPDTNMYVNDGGSLGEEGLLAFKMKLNPKKQLMVLSTKGIE